MPGSDEGAPAARDAEARNAALEAELAELRRRFDDVLDGAGQAYWELDVASDTLNCSPQWWAQIGLPARPEPISGADLFARIHADDRDAAQQQLREAIIGTAGALDIRFRMKHADGGWRWLLTRAKLIREPSGRCLALRGVQADITATRQLEAATLDTQLRFRSLYENAPLAFVIWDREGRITDWNARAEALFGHPRAAALGRRFVSLLFPVHGQEAMAETARELIRHGGANQREVENLAADGRVLHCAWHNVALKNSRGTTAGVISLVQDNTERWQAEEVRRRDEARNRALVETSPDAILMLDTAGWIITVNQQAVRLLGLDDSSDLIGTHAAIWVDDAQHDDFTTRVIELPEDRVGFIAQREFLLAGADDSMILADMHYTTLGDAQGEPLGIVLFARDITDKRRQERELALYRENLETLVADRTAELDEARAAAEQAARTKAEFLANMSHEIRTPMNAVIGLAHLALRTPLNPRQRDYLERIHGAGGMLLGLVNDLLDFSKIEAGKLTMESAPFVFDEVLDNVATLVGGRAREKGLEFHFLIDPDVPSSLVGDPLRLSQVLVNLCGNAIKFTEQGHVAVRVACAAPEGVDGTPSVRLRFAVEDTGIGLTEEQAGRLFQAFSQADTSTTRKFGGTGLGLIIAKRIVELMDGHIGLTSQPGAGTTFHFDARFGTGTEAADHAARVPAALRGTAAHIADRHPQARAALAQALERLGFVVTTADRLDAETAPAADLVFVDAGLADVATAARRLRARAAPPRVVLLAHRDPQELEALAVDAGADDMLPKPATLARLLRVLAGLCGEVAADIASGGDAPAHLRGQRVLLADDIATNRLIAVELLGSWGLEVEVAENGRIAMEKALAAMPAAILMDIQMPEMDGIEATQRLRAAGCTVPIIAMTAHTLAEERERCLAAGMNDMVTKPIDPPALLATLVRHLPGRPGEVADARPVPAPAAVAPSPASAAPPPEALGLPDLPGIDTADGLRRMMGKVGFYRRILQDFGTRFDGHAAAIAAALRADDAAEAERQAHSAKGLAASIGAVDLAAAAGQLESSLRSGEEADAALAHYGEELDRVVAGLRAAFPRDA